jgi:hypothetical protein
MKEGVKHRKACRWGWMKRCLCPTRKETESARVKLVREMKSDSCSYRGQLYQAFAQKEMPVETAIVFGGRLLIFCGAHSEMLFPQAMIFYDPYRHTSVQYYGLVVSPVRILGDAKKYI